jgi:hypothetical protein
MASAPPDTSADSRVPPGRDDRRHGPHASRELGEHGDRGQRRLRVHWPVDYRLLRRILHHKHVQAPEPAPGHPLDLEHTGEAFRRGPRTPPTETFALNAHHGARSHDARP